MKADKSPDVLFKKKLLHERIADILRTSILKGVWTTYLPTERSLCLKVEASRPVLRKALHTLADEGLVKITYGHPTRIIASALKKRAPVKKKHVVLLFQGGAHTRLGNWQTTFFDELRSRLASEGFSLELVVDRRLSRKRVDHVLKEIVQQHEADHWILSSVPLAVQEWFQKERLPVMIDGSSFPNIDLPSADFDHRATGRHAAGVFLGLGHRSIVSFIRAWGTAGVRAMEDGFMEAFKGHNDAVPRVIHHTGDIGMIRSRVKSLLALKDPPTAIIVSDAMDFLVVMTSLLEWGIRIPKDISLIALHPESFMDQLTPCPARYEIDSIKQAQAVCRLVKNPAYGGGKIRQIPPFHPGASLARPPGRQS